MLFVALATLSPSACAPAQSAQLPAELSAKQWRDDLRAFARELPKKHANAFHAMSRARFDSSVAALDTRLDSANADAAVVGFASLAASIGDGHTRVRLPGNWTRTPLVLGWFGCLTRSAGPCELRVTAAAPGYERALGSRVEAVDGTSAADMHRRLAATITKGETEGWTWALSALYAQFPNVLRGLGVARSADALTFTLADSAGAPFELRATSVPRASVLAGWPAAASPAPLSRARGEPLWFQLLPDSQTVYLSFDSTRTRPRSDRSRKISSRSSMPGARRGW